MYCPLSATLTQYRTGAALPWSARRTTAVATPCTINGKRPEEELLIGTSSVTGGLKLAAFYKSNILASVKHGAGCVMLLGQTSFL